MGKRSRFTLYLCCREVRIISMVPSDGEDHICQEMTVTPINSLTANFRSITFLSSREGASFLFHTGTGVRQAVGH